MNLHLVMLIVIPCLLGYALGSIPFGYLLAKKAGYGDIRRLGSGNIGATNLLRVGGKKLGGLTLLLDGTKGLAAVLLALWLDMNPNLAGGACVLGHMYPIWLNFKGGKGVATFCGVILGWGWLPGVITIAIWLTTFKITRISSKAGLAATVGGCVALLLTDHGNTLFVAIPLAVLILYHHADNIRRILLNQEMPPTANDE